MLYREIIAVCCEIHTNTLCGLNVECVNVNIQDVPRSKHTSSLLYKPVS